MNIIIKWNWFIVNTYFLFWRKKSVGTGFIVHIRSYLDHIWPFVCQTGCILEMKNIGMEVLLKQFSLLEMWCFNHSHGAYCSFFAQFLWSTDLKQHFSRVPKEPRSVVIECLFVNSNFIYASNYNKAKWLSEFEF